MNKDQFFNDFLLGVVVGALLCGVLTFLFPLSKPEFKPVIEGGVLLSCLPIPNTTGYMCLPLRKEGQHD